MAKYNKTELDSQVDTALVPTLTLETHKTLLKDDVNDSTELKKRRVTSAAMTANAYGLDFQDVEMYDIDCNDRAMNFTVSNLTEGQSGYVKFTDFDGGSIAFSNVILIGGNKDNGRSPIVPDVNIYKTVNIRGVYYGYYKGADPTNPIDSFDFDNFHALNTDIRVAHAIAWTNGPFAPSSILSTLHIRTTVSTVVASSEYSTMYEVTIMGFNTGYVRKFIGYKIHTAAISWTELT